jgi:predicted AlkP superfamily phosphohydrolase/phosphomutase
MPRSVGASRFRSAVSWLRRAAKRRLPRSIKGLLKKVGLRDSVDSFLTQGAVDWSRTRAYGFGTFGNIRINLRGREPAGCVEPGQEYERLRDSICADLLDLRDPGDGRKLVARAHRREELYTGDCLKSAPDIVIEWEEYATYPTLDLGSQNGDGHALFIDSSDFPHVATHRMEGMLVLAGAGVRRGQALHGASLLDLAPTIIELLGGTRPAHLEGRVLSEALQQSAAGPPPQAQVGHFAPGERDATEVYTEQEHRAIEERLRGLGYLD